MVYESGNSQKASCSYGVWLLAGFCIKSSFADSVKVEKTQALQARLIFDVATPFSNGGDGEIMDGRWAEENKDVVATGLARALEVESNQILIKVVGVDEIVANASQQQQQMRLLAAAAGFGRQLQDEYSPNAFGIHTYVIVREGLRGESSGVEYSAEVNELRTRISRLGGGDADGNPLPADLKSSGASMFAHMEDVLVESGQSVPEGIRSMVAVVPFDPEFIREVVVPRNEWMMGPWSECSTSCGEGVRSRILECPGFAAEGACGNPPATTKKCLKWDECSFNMMCPTRGATQEDEEVDPPCEQQSIACILILAAIGLCCIGFYLRRKCRQPIHGTVHLQELNVKANWILQSYSSTGELEGGSSSRNSLGIPEGTPRREFSWQSTRSLRSPRGTPRQKKTCCLGLFPRSC
jgi:hypothetical protein